MKILETDDFDDKQLTALDNAFPMLGRVDNLIASEQSHDFGLLHFTLAGIASMFGFAGVMYGLGMLVEYTELDQHLINLISP